MTTYMAKAGDVEQKWLLVDATDKIVGRLASDIAVILMGKHRPTYTPHVDTGDFVVVINADKVKFTGNKWEDKEYRWTTGYTGQRSDQGRRPLRASPGADSARSRPPDAAEKQAGLQDDHQAEDLRRRRTPTRLAAADPDRASHQEVVPFK